MENASRGWKTLRGGQGKRFAGVRLGFRFSATGIDMAGASVNGGYTHSETDEYCYDITADPVHVHSLNATIMHLMVHQPRTFDLQVDIEIRSIDCVK